MHIFHNISFEADIHQANSKIVWEKQLVAFIQDQFLPKLAYILDEWDSKNPNLQCIIENIDLEIDLDSFDAKLATNELVYQFKTQLQQIDLENPESTYKLKVKITPKATQFEAFLKYLKTGKLSKEFTVNQVKHWLSVKKIFSKQEQKTIRQLIIKDHNALYRLHQAFYDESYQNIAKIVTIEKIIQDIAYMDASYTKAILQKIHQELHLPIAEEKIKIWTATLSTATSLKRYVETFLKLMHTTINMNTIHIPSITKLELAIFQAILQYKYNSNITIKIENLLHISFNASSNEAKKTLRETQDKLENISRDSENHQPRENTTNPKKDNLIDENKATQELKKVLAEEGIKTHEEYLSKEGKSGTVQSQNSSNENLDKQHLIKDISNGKKKNKTETNYRSLQDHEMVSTGKAGLVLVHPFLNIFFKELQLLSEKNEITNPERAAVLLHYLATGNEEYIDLDLALEKILLTIPLEVVISKNIHLTNQEKEAADVLLQAVLQHWNVLKNSSVDALRQMFLKREGIIQETDKAFKISIERLAQDVLLDRLPWGIGMIRLAWKKKFINVEWS